MLLVGAPLGAQTEEPKYSAIEVYWQSSHRLLAEGVTSAVIVNEEICRVEVGNGYLTFYGLNRGETIAHIWVGDKVATLQVHVIEKPMAIQPPRLEQRSSESSARGAAGSTVTVSTSSEGADRWIGMHRIDWQQAVDGRRVSFRAVAQNANGTSNGFLNLNTGSLEITGARSAFSLLDFTVDTGGGFNARLAPIPTYNTLVIRGAALSLKRGANEYQFFAGARTPAYFLSFAGSGETAGFNFARNLTSKARVFATSAATSTPMTPDPGRAKGGFQTAGLTYRFSKELALTGTAGLSNRGGMAQLGLAYDDPKITAYAMGSRSARRFPLNELQLYYPGATSANAGVAYRWSRALSTNVGLYRSTAAPTGFSRSSGGSMSLMPGITVSGAGQNFTFVYTFQKMRLGNESKEHLSRYQVSYQSNLGRIMSSFQGEYSSQWAAGPYDAKQELRLREAFVVPTSAGTFTFGVAHFRADPSILDRARARLSLLDPSYRDLIENNPAGFSLSVLPPNVQELLADFRTTGYEVFADASLHLGTRLSIVPHVAVNLQNQGSSVKTQTHSLAYNLNYRVSPTLQIQSSLAEMLYLNSATSTLQQARTISAGLTKSFSGGPRFFTPLDERGSIVGYVFRDSDVDGIYQTGEPGLPGVRVELEEGGSTVTDAKGMYSFARLERKAYHVRMPLDQFRDPIRVTTPNEAAVNLEQRPSGSFSFGVVNFARVIGTVYNDYRLAAKRQPDAPPVPNIRLELSGVNGRYPIQSDSNGYFEVRDVLPGDYELSLDPESLPANYEPVDGPIAVSVFPTKTVVVDVPVRALRTISGTIALQKPGEKTSKPLAGVRVRVDDQTVVTDGEGRFVFRNLAAGEHVLTVVPYSEPPKDLAVPAGRFKMSMEPTNLENVTIVINNPDLVSYLQPVPEKQMATARPD